jgi:hypothetical protein
MILMTQKASVTSGTLLSMSAAHVFVMLLETYPLLDLQCPLRVWAAVPSPQLLPSRVVAERAGRWSSLYQFNMTGVFPRLYNSVRFPLEIDMMWATGTRFHGKG